MGDLHDIGPLSTHGTIQTQNKRSQTSMLRMGFELTIPLFERAKTVHALVRPRGHCNRLIPSLANV
jgi:hypothetical protein